MPKIKKEILNSQIDLEISAFELQEELDKAVQTGKADYDKINKLDRAFLDNLGEACKQLALSDKSLKAHGKKKKN